MKRTIGLILLTLILIPIIVGALAGLGWAFYLIGNFLWSFAAFVGKFFLGFLATVLALAIALGIIGGIVVLLEDKDSKNVSN